MKVSLLAAIALCALLPAGRPEAAPAGASDVKAQVVAGRQIQVAWKDKLVVAPSRPELRRLGPGPREWFDPNTRRYCKIDVPAGQDGFLTVYNTRRRKVYLGEAKATLREEAGGVIYREEFPAAETHWQVSLTPVDRNGLDLLLEVETAPEYWLGDFDIHLLDLNLADAASDSGAISAWYRKSRTMDSLGPLTGPVSICYPNGPNCFVPAAVLQDSRFAVGICLLDAHRTLRPDYSELTVAPDAGKRAYRVWLRSSENPFFGNVYRQTLTKRFRLRFSEPRPAGALSLLDAKELWKDCLDELDRYVPSVPAPRRDPGKNNVLLMNFFMAEYYHSTPENPNGWVMHGPEWKSNPWEWRGKVTPGMDDAAVKRITGFSSENYGRPVKWIKPFAEKCIRDLKEGNCQAMITWTSALNYNGPDTMYIPESHLFHPELEERMPAEGPVRSYDWVLADIRVSSPNGEPVTARKGVLLHAANPEQLIQLDQMARAFGAEQRIKLKRDDILPAGEKYLARAGQLDPKDRLTDKNVLILKVPAPREKLLGLKPGDRAELEAAVVSDDPEVARQKLKLVVEIREVQRAAIDVWAKMLADAGQEFGFLVREDFTVGPPWSQHCQRFDWSADWQYKMLKQRIQWHRERFGEKCRWFYLDVFGNYTPPFVFDMLRADYPDCFFFAEHPNDAVLRTVQGWNWDGPMSDLERAVAPDGIVTVLPDRLLTGNTEKDREILRKLWNNPHCFLVTHRSVPRLLKLIQGE